MTAIYKALLQQAQEQSVKVDTFDSFIFIRNALAVDQVCRSMHLCLLLFFYVCAYVMVCEGGGGDAFIYSLIHSFNQFAGGSEKRK